jgi:hypothetical protein
MAAGNPAPITPVPWDIYRFRTNRPESSEAQRKDDGLAPQSFGTFPPALIASTPAVRLVRAGFDRYLQQIPISLQCNADQLATITGSGFPE